VELLIARFIKQPIDCCESRIARIIPEQSRKRNQNARKTAQNNPQARDKIQPLAAENQPELWPAQAKDETAKTR
jgi:hypothetical protein